MSRVLAHAAITAAAIVNIGCGGSTASNPGTVDANAVLATGMGADVDRDVARIRAATAAYHALDAAVADGYPREVSSCIANAQQGGMGYHHQNAALLDDVIELERPEILVYERMPDGEYRLNGVEYVVPFSVRPPTAEPPVVMGQPLKPAPSLGIWYRHVWVWRENPSGLFADWNPQVKC